MDANDRVDFFDALLVAIYSGDPSTVMPNNGNISRGDVNADGRIDLTDAYLIASWLNDASDPTLPAGIGEGGVGSPDCAALVALYEATDGDNWTNNTNWLSDKPLGDWFGVTTNDDGRVTSLELGGNQLSGGLPSSLDGLPHLQVLYLYENALSGSLPEWLGNLTNLRELDLYENDFSGGLPAWLGNLTNLQVLHLDHTQLSGALPSSLVHLTNLRVLYQDNTQLCAPTDDAFQTWLQGIERTRGVVNCQGDEPDDRAVLVALYEAADGDNWKDNTNWLSDKPLGDWYGVTTNDNERVTHLELHENGLSGGLPAWLGNLTHLQALYLNDNQLSGSIPSSWENLSNLQEVALRNNQLSGCIPAGLRDVSDSDLDELGLSYCGLSDTVPEKTELKHPKVGSALDELIARIEAGEISEEEAAQEAPLYRGKSAAVTIYLSSNVDGVVSFLEANGVSARNVGEDFIEAFVPVLLLAETSEQPGVLWVQVIQPPQPPESFEASSTVPGNGPELHGSPAWNQAGYRGQGIKMGVIDVGFEDIRSLMGSELPQTIKARCYSTSSDEPTDDPGDCENGENHGTIVAETVVDIAPEVSLYIAVPKSNGDMRNAVDWMISEGVSVINHSVGWFFDGPGDGTSPYSWSPLNTVDRAVESGIVWVNSAGNEAQGTWFKRGPSDTDGDGFLEFRDGEEEITVNWWGEKWNAIQVRWSGNWKGATRDLDLYLYRNGQIVKSSTNPQEGERWQRPHELVWISDAGRYKVKVVARDDDLPQWVQLVAWKASIDQYTENGSITNPAESTNSGMLTVGAAHWWTPNTIANYSSRGPTPDGRVKPDIVGAACGETALVSAFCGTSQASPHVAGMAALVRQRFPKYTPARVAAYLKDNAEQRVHSSDPNNTWGHGFAVLPPPPEDTAAAAALEALYKATDGDNWTDNTHWLSDKPLGEWFGVTTDDGRVTHLELAENGLSGTLPSSLGDLAYLEVLTLFRNDLSGSLPSSLGNLTRLERLWLGRNQLSGELPSWLVNLTNLQRLELGYNQFSGSLPSSLGNLINLRVLWLGGNQFSGELPSSLVNLTNLEELDLRDMQLCAPPDAAFQTWLEGIDNKRVVNCRSTPKMYWTDDQAGKIQRANLDGSRVEDLVTGLIDPSALALDLDADKMYWTDDRAGKIQRANLDGTGVEDLITGLGRPQGLALDLGAGKIYWTAIGTDKIQRANLDGSRVEDLVTGVRVSLALALDLDAGKIYWTDWYADKIQRANLDGSRVEDLVTGASFAFDLALDLGRGKMYWTDLGKVRRANLDGTGVQDLATGFTPLGLALDLGRGKMYWTDLGKVRRANLDGTGIEDLITGLDHPYYIELDLGN